MKVTNPILLIMLFAFTFASAFAQPLPDPFTVSETDSDAVVSDVRITMRDNAIVDVFFLETRGTAVSPDNHLLHAVVSLTTEQIIAGPEDMPVENGWNLIIGDVASRGNDGWLAMIYESQSVSMDNWIVNRTSLLYGQNNIQGVVELDTGRAQETASPPYNCEIAHSNAQFGISERVGGGWLLHWVRRGCQMFPDSLESFPRNTAQLVALSSSMDIDARTSCCSEDYSFGAQEVRCVSATPDTTVVLSMDWTENGAAEPFPVMMKWLSLSGNCISRGIPGALFSHIVRTRSGRFLALAPRLGGISGATSYLAELDRITGSTLLSTLPFNGWNPVAFHPDYGFAFLSLLNNSQLFLARIDTSGSQVQQIGVFFQSDAAHAITKAILAITDDGRVVVFWTESTVDSAHASVIKAAWVDWTTYLAVTDPDFILPPTSFSLSAFPNPFNARTVIRFTLPERANVSLDIFDLSGRKTAELAHGAFEAGEHSLVFDASDKPSGVYFVTMEAGKQQVSQKILLLK